MPEFMGHLEPETSIGKPCQQVGTRIGESSNINPAINSTIKSRSKEPGNLTCTA